jgi:glucose/arabinose dehydrogenase
MKINSIRNSIFSRFSPVILLMIIFFIGSGCKKVQEKINPADIQSRSNNGSQEMKGVDIKLIADNFVSPIGLVALPDRNGKFEDRDDDRDRRRDDDQRIGDKRLFVIDQVGKIWIIDANGNKLPIPFLDLTTKLVPLSPGYDERGLLGLAFHPNYKKNGRFFVYYTAPPRPGGPQPGSLWNNLSRISEFRVSSLNPNLADMSSERAILELNDPQSNHNGGTLAFGPDGHLYISIGDGGGADDVAPGHVEDWYPVNKGGNGQDIESNLFGNILRLDVNNGSPYGIPRDNPFVGKRGLDEIYAFGFRNPFRFSFDMGGSHQLIAGDAGQVLYEEIDLVKKGGNYGWNVKEGRHCFNAAHDNEELGSCPMVDPSGNVLIDPVIEINNWQNPEGGKATTVIGGNVYRGHSIPQFQGKYIFGTFSQSIAAANGELFMANTVGQSNWPFQEISLKSSPNDVGYYLKGFGQDQEGEIYLTVSSRLGPAGISGKVFKLVPVKGAEEDKN